MSALIAIFFILFAVILNLAILGVTLYGVVLGFRKVWYAGLAALVFPLFGFVLGFAKLFAKKDLLN